jgi:hypothetical protein
MKLAALAMLIVVIGCDAASEPSGPPAGPQAATMEQLLGPWSPTPFVPSPAVVAAAEQACRAMHIPDFPRMAPGAQNGFKLAIVDVRGAGVAQAYFTDADAQVTCADMTIDRDGTIVARGGGSRSGGGAPAGLLDPFEIRITDTSWSQDAQAISSRAAGLIGAGIARIEVVRPGQPLVRATIANGWFAAWVPAAMPAGWSVRGFDASGAQVTSVPAP